MGQSGKERLEVNGFVFLSQVFGSGQSYGYAGMPCSDEGVQITRAGIDDRGDSGFVHDRPCCLDEWVGKGNSTVFALGHDLKANGDSRFQGKLLAQLAYLFLHVMEDVVIFAGDLKAKRTPAGTGVESRPATQSAKDHFRFGFLGYRNFHELVYEPGQVTDCTGCTESFPVVIARYSKGDFASQRT